MDERIYLDSDFNIELDPDIWVVKQIIKNVTIEIEENTRTKEIKIGWYKQSNSEEIDDIEDFYEEQEG